MAESEKPKLGAESPTAARELNFEDEPLDTPAAPQPAKPNSGIDHSSTNPKPTSEDIPPPQPPRPLSPRQQAENTLKEAFPSIDGAVVRAVLTASGGQVEPAFNALLGMSDPDSQQEPPPPPQPPRPVPSTRRPPATQQSQLEADEAYARQLYEEYNGTSTLSGHPRSVSRGNRQPALPKPKKETGLKPNELYDDREHSFIDDDLPVIKDQLKKGFLETQKTVNSFITSLKKRIDGDDEDDLQGRPSSRPTHQSDSIQGQTPHQYPVRQSGEYARRSADRERYDADPQVLGDDFTGLHLRDETAPKFRSTRPLANPDLFKPTPNPPPSTGRRVSFQEGPPEEIDDLYRSSPDPTKRPSSSASRSKWQPLAAVDPHPVADHDPFSLGDSDDEESKKQDVKAEDTERLKKAAADAAVNDQGLPGTGELRPQQTVGGAGTRDKEAENLIGKS